MKVIVGMSRTDDRLDKIDSELKEIKDELGGPSFGEVLNNGFEKAMSAERERNKDHIEKNRKEHNRPEWVGTVQNVIGGCLVLFGGLYIFFFGLMSTDYNRASSFGIGFILAAIGYMVVWA
jgi:hypothetical protein